MAPRLVFYLLKALSTLHRSDYHVNMDAMFHHVQKHGKFSNHWKLHLNDPANLLINIIYYN